jgi:hypothetical protein
MYIRRFSITLPTLIPKSLECIRQSAPIKVPGVVVDPALVLKHGTSLVVLGDLWGLALLYCIRLLSL